jgi:hypothetical protein
LNPSESSELERFIDWASQACLGQDLSAREVHCSYHLFFLYIEGDDVEGAKIHAREALPELLETCRERAAPFWKAYAQQAVAADRPKAGSGWTAALPEMEFIDVTWRHKTESDPIRLVSELDEQRYEKRKLEFFADGRVGFASSASSSEGTMLGVEPVPPLSEINSDVQFSGSNISSADFEALWGRHARVT